MIQDIGSGRFNNAFICKSPDKTDTVLRFDHDGRVLVSSENNRIIFPGADGLAKDSNTVYLFSVDEKPYYLLISDMKTEIAGFCYQDLRQLRGTCENADLFIIFTAYHLWRWYMDSRFCGRCGHKLVHKKDERALICGSCSNTIYPRINPAVIVGVIRDGKILITRYRTGYAHNALVAGFTEIGETLEQTVSREVMEETGIRVKNIRYYKSQPWGIAQDVLTGFFCEAEGDGDIVMDEKELKYAEWVKREDLELQPNDISLTNEMMKVFKEGGPWEY